MPRVYLTSYATSRFEAVQRELNVSALESGIPNILSYREIDLKSSDYYRANRSILDEVTGAGAWAWKPYFILRALDQLEENDILFYCDAGSLLVQPADPLIQLCASHPQGLLLFDIRPLTNGQFTKRDTFVRMDCDEPRFWNAPMVMATLLVMRKTEIVRAFVKEWLTYCEDRVALIEAENVCGKPDLPAFLQHRWDQSILSILAAKHQLETFRNPTHWGNFLKLPAFRVTGEPVAAPYDLPPHIDTYAASPQDNSPYGTLFVINRLPNHVGKKPLPSPTSSQPDQPFFRRLLSQFRGRKKGGAT